MPKSKLRKNRKTGIQRIMSTTVKTFKEVYLTVKGKRLIAGHGLTKETKQAIYDLYGKNRYTINPAKVVKTITHRI